MKDGIFYVVFRNSGHGFGEGTVVINNNKVNGGDSNHTYSGHIKDNLVKLNVHKHRKSALSIFDQESNYRINLTFQESGFGLSLKGHVENNQDITIEADAKFIGELAI